MIRDQLTRNHVQIVTGEGRFVDPHTIAVRVSEDNERTLTADVDRDRRRHRPGPARRRRVRRAHGARLRRHPGLGKIPGSLVVVGAGVIGIEYASMFAALGTKVTVVEKRHRLLDFCDDQIVEALQYHLRDLGVTFRFGERVVGVELHDGGSVTELESGKRIPSDAVLYAAGRAGRHRARSTSRRPAWRRRPRPDRGRRDVPDGGAAHLRGRRRDRLPEPRRDVDRAGPPGRVHARSARRSRRPPTYLPIGIYTIPEISLRRQDRGGADRPTGCPYEIGISR